MSCPCFALPVLPRKTLRALRTVVIMKEILFHQCQHILSLKQQMIYSPCKSTKSTSSLESMIPVRAREVSIPVSIDTGYHTESDEARKPEQRSQSIETQHNKFMTQLVAKAWNSYLIANNQQRPYRHKDHEIGLRELNMIGATEPIGDGQLRHN